MSHFDEIKSKLQLYPLVRERKNKNVFIARLLLNKFSSRLQTGIDEKLMEDIIVTGASYDRNFRQVLQECPELRGSDYSDKQSLEEDKMLQLGYQPKIKEDKIIKEIAKPYKDHE